MRVDIGRTCKYVEQAYMIDDVVLSLCLNGSFIILPLQRLSQAELCACGTFSRRERKTAVVNNEDT